MPIRYSPNFKPTPPKQPQQTDLGNSMRQFIQMHGEMKQMHDNMLNLHGQIQKGLVSIKQGPPGPQGPMGYAGNHGQSVDEEQVLKKLSAKIPKAKDGRPGRDGKNADPDAIVDAVAKRFQEGKIKLKGEHIEGWQSPEVLLQRFHARGGIRGGGDTVAAGSGITITTTNGVKTIAAGASTTQVFNEVAGGSGTAFTIAHTPASGTLRVFALGQRLTPTTDFSLAGANITTVNSWSAGNLLLDYSY